MSEECVKVVVRCRPMNAKEKGRGCESVVKVIEDLNQIQLVNPRDGARGGGDGKSFTFDGVYGPQSKQIEVFVDTAEALVESVLEGYNGTMFAYGQTGCGKTHTMEGLAGEEMRGIIPRCFSQIFEAMTHDENKDTQFLISTAYIEIYNEDIRDLLGKDAVAKLPLKEDPDRGVYIKGLTWTVVKDVAHLEKLMKQGNVNRTTGATLMNATSSRSHSIFMINIETSKEAPDGGVAIRAGKLNLVDLAGSERQSKTQAEGKRLQEAVKINLSLSALGNVISALVAGRPHIPYRDSKLTRLLQDSLGGNTKTIMVAAISPADYNYEETLSTLRYANRAKNITNKVRINEDPKDALLREYQEEIARLKQLLSGQGIDMAAALGGTGGSGGGGGGGRRRVKRIVKKINDKGEEEEEEVSDYEEEASPRRRVKYNANGDIELRDGFDGTNADLQREAQSIKQHQKKLEEQKKQHEEMAKELERQMDHEREAKAKALQERDKMAHKLSAVHQKEQDRRDEIARDLEQRMMEEKQRHEQQAKQLAADIVDEQKRNEELLAELKERNSAVEVEKTNLMSRLESLQQKLMRGRAVRLTDKQRQEQELLTAAQKIRKAKKKQILAKKKALEEEEAKLLVESKYASQQEELIGNQQKVKQLQERLRKQQDEMDDLVEEFERERERMLEDMRQVYRDVALHKQVCLSFIRPADYEAIVNGAAYNKDKDEWILPRITMPIFQPKIGDAVRKTSRSSGHGTDIVYQSSKYGNHKTAVDSKRGWRVAPNRRGGGDGGDDDDDGSISSRNGDGSTSTSSMRRGSSGSDRQPVDIADMALPQARPSFQPAGTVPMADDAKTAASAAAKARSDALLTSNLPSRPAFRPAAGAGGVLASSSSSSSTTTGSGKASFSSRAEISMQDAKRRQNFQPAAGLTSGSGGGKPAADVSSLLSNLPPKRAAFTPAVLGSGGGAGPQPPAGGGGKGGFAGRRFKEP